MKKFLVKVEYRNSQFESVWNLGKDIQIEARDLRSAISKAEKKGSVYTHYTVIEEISTKAGY